MKIHYDINRMISTDTFIDLLKRSTLAERRPIEHNTTMKGMIENSNLLVTAWDNDLLVGVSRSLTDFHYACYLSDLAVDEHYQQQGIGKTLIQQTKEQLGEYCKLLLVSAPAANGFYPKIGFEKNDKAWVLPPGKSLSD